MQKTSPRGDSVPIDAPERGVRCSRTVHPDDRANEMSLVGGVCGTTSAIGSSALHENFIDFGRGGEATTSTHAFLSKKVNTLRCQAPPRDLMVGGFLSLISGYWCANVLRARRGAPHPPSEPHCSTISKNLM